MRNWQLIKELLITIDSKNIEIDDVDKRLPEIANHMKMLIDGKFIYGDFHIPNNFQFTNFTSAINKFRLTFKGEDLLDCLNCDLFAKTHNALIKHHTNGSYKAITAITNKLLTKEILKEFRESH